MRAVVMCSYGPPDVLRMAEMPVPEPRRGEVLVRTDAVGVNAIDWKTRAGHGVRVPTFPGVLGWDIAGTVVSAAPDVTVLSIGDEVYGMPRFPALAGGYAEYVAAPAADMARIPPEIGRHAAAGTPMVALTVWQALFEQAGVRPGQRVLVHGAAGGTGHVAVQLANAAGAEVTGTASARSRDFLLALGAHQVVGYDDGQIEKLGRQFDVTLDTRGGPDFIRLIGTVRPGGVLVTLVGEGTGDREAARSADVRPEFTYVAPDGAVLARAGQFIAAHNIRVSVAQVLPLEEAARAHATGEAGHVRGRLVLETR